MCRIFFSFRDVVKCVGFRELSFCSVVELCEKRQLLKPGFLTHVKLAMLPHEVSAMLFCVGFHYCHPSGNSFWTNCTPESHDLVKDSMPQDM